MFGIGPTELLIVFVIIIIFFGAKRLPELARSLGRSIKEFKQATQGLGDELNLTNIDEKPLPHSQGKAGGDEESGKGQSPQSKEKNH